MKSRSRDGLAAKGLLYFSFCCTLGAIKSFPCLINEILIRNCFLEVSFRYAANSERHMSVSHKAMEIFLCSPIWLCFRLCYRAKNELKFSKITEIFGWRKFSVRRKCGVYPLDLLHFVTIFQLCSVPFLDFVYLMKLVQCFWDSVALKAREKSRVQCGWFWFCFSLVVKLAQNF